MGADCVVHCSKVSKPVKGKYLLLCMNSIMHFLLTSYTLITFLSFNSRYNEIFHRSGLEIFQNFREIFKYFKVKYFIVHPYVAPANFSSAKDPQSFCG